MSAEAHCRKENKNMQNTLIKIDLPQVRDAGVELWIHHLGQDGNKGFKLKYNLLEMQRQKQNTLLTFGGAYSNHIAAAAKAGKKYGFNTIGIIRGEELNEKSSEVLETAYMDGMRFHFVSREKYRRMRNDNENSLTELKNLFGNFYLLPEGGSNELGVKGCMEITEGLPDFDFICTAAGTGATLAGIALTLRKHQQAIGFAVLGDAEFLNGDVESFIKNMSGTDAGLTQWSINHNYHFGRYARVNDELRKFVSGFKEKTGVELDLIYTGKMMFGVMDLIEKGKFVCGERIFAVHTFNRR